MKFEDLDIFVLTSDKSIKICDAFQKIYSSVKLPNSNVYFLGYSNPKFELMNKFNFISINDVDTGPKCCTHVKNFFKTYDKEHFILTVDDLPPVIQRNNLTNLIFEYFLEQKNIGRFGLTHDVKRSTNNFKYSTENNIDYIKVYDDSNYKLSLVWSIWNKNFLLENLIDGQDLWEFEVDQNKKCKLDIYSVQGVNQYDHSIIDMAHLYKRGKVRENYKYMVYSKKIINQNFIDLIESTIK